MKSRLLATLQDAIQTWANNECEAADWPSLWMYDALVVDMAKAAAAIFDATIASQEFAKEQQGGMKVLHNAVVEPHSAIRCNAGLGVTVEPVTQACEQRRKQ
jgi:hypothetical protein